MDTSIRLLLAAVIVGTISLAPAQAATKDGSHPARNPASSLKKGEIPTVDYFRRPGYRNAHLSPDGRLLAMVTYPDQTAEYMTIVDLASLRSVDVAKTSANDEAFSIPEWVADDTIVFTDNELNAPSYLISLRWDGFDEKKPRTHITTWPEGVDFVDVARGDHQAYVLSAPDESDRRVLYRVGINVGEKDLVAANKLMFVDGNQFDLKVDRNGILRLAVREDEDGTRHFLWRKSAKEPWMEYRKVAGDEMFWPIGFEPDGTHILVVSDAGRDTRALREFDLHTGEFTKTVIGDPHADVTNYVADWRTHAVTGVVLYENGTEHFRMIDADKLLQLPALKLAFPGQLVTPIDQSRDGNTTLVFVSSDRSPGAYYVYDSRSNRAQLIGKVAEWLPQAKMAHVQARMLKTADGLDISYFVALPSVGKGPFPLVVVPHGGPHDVFDTTDFDSETQLLADRGFAVLKVNYRGSGGSGKHLVDAGKRQWGEGIESAVTAALRKVLATYPVDPARVCIFGGSYGGYSALMGVIKHPELYRCAASFAGVTDVGLLASGIVGGNPGLKKDFVEFIGDPSRDMGHFRAISPVYLAEKITRPIFLAQGLKDNRVDPEQAYRMRAVLDVLHKDVEFKTYPDEGHGFDLVADEVDFYDRLVDFMRRNMGKGQTLKKVAARH